MFFFYPGNISEMNYVTDAPNDKSESIEERTIKEDSSIRNTSDKFHPEKNDSDEKDERKSSSSSSNEKDGSHTNSITCNTPLIVLPINEICISLLHNISINE